jgi:hypothetical protein
MEVADGSIDVLFAGMPRAPVWPPDAAAPPPSPTTMFDPPRRVSSVVHRHPRPHEEAAPADATASDAAGEAPSGPSGDADAATIGLWEAAAAAAAPAHDADAAPDVAADVKSVGETDGPNDQPTGETELDLGRAALEAGDTNEAAVRLGLVLRVAPALAPAVLDLIDGRTEREMALVRGDAYRLVGREIEARQAFVEAARGGSWPPPAPEAQAAPEPPPALEAPAQPEPPPDPSTDPPTEGDPA